MPEEMTGGSGILPTTSTKYATALVWEPLSNGSGAIGIQTFSVIGYAQIENGAFVAVLSNGGIVNGQGPVYEIWDPTMTTEIDAVKRVLSRFASSHQGWNGPAADEDEELRRKSFEDVVSKGRFMLGVLSGTGAGSGG
jgi:hypothetical protein